MNLIKKLTLKRSVLERFLGHVRFEEALKGCLVKVNFQPLESSKSDYRIAEVQMVVEKFDQPYKLKFKDKTTPKYLRCSVQDKLIDYEINYISDQPIQEEQVSRWI